MASRPAELSDIVQGRRKSRLRLFAPMRYLLIQHPEKAKYDIVLPLAWGVGVGVMVLALAPGLPIFGEAGALKFARDLLVMGVPFLIGALATVAMAGPSEKLDRRPPGAEIILDGEVLTLRQFVCRLLGYVSFVALCTLLGAVAADLIRPTLLGWMQGHIIIHYVVRSFGLLCLSVLLSALIVTTLWSLYFLSDMVTRPSKLPLGN